MRFISFHDVKRGWRTVAFTIALGFFVFGTKVVVIDRYGSDIPNWDQWDAEAEMLLLPYYQGKLSFLDLFTPHNEHRVALTKALSLGVVLVNGQWDARLQCVINALIHTSIAVAVFLYLRVLFSVPLRAGLCVIVAILFGLPVAPTNVLSAFHSQQVFLVGFSLAAVALMAGARTFDRRWFAGIACMIGALFSMGSGLLAAVAVMAAVVGANGFPGIWRRHKITTILCVLTFVAGWELRVSVPYHEALKAHQFGDFFWTVWHNLQWPATGLLPFAVLSFLPWALLGGRVLLRRGGGDPREATIFGAGLWVLLQFLATAYARGAGGGWPADRYLDTVALGLLVNAASILVLAAHAPPSGNFAVVRTAVFAAWLLIAGLGLFAHVRSVYETDFPALKSYYVKAERCTRAYLATGDEKYLDDPNIPYPGKGTLIERLAHPEIRAILPMSIRPPLHITGQAEPANSFVVLPESHKFALPWTTWRSGGPEEPPAKGIWTSTPLPKSRFRYWWIDVTGHLGRPDVTLQIVALNSRRILATAIPRRSALDAWRPTFVRAPRVDAQLVARDDSDVGWLGFAQPVEVATLSLVALWTVKQGITLVVLGIMLVVFAAGRPTWFAIVRIRPRFSWNWPRRPVAMPIPPIAKFREFAIWYGLGGLFLAACLSVVVWPDYFTTPAFQSRSGILVARVLLCLLSVAAVWLAIRTTPVNPTERNFFAFFCLAAALFCEVEHYWIVDRGHMFPVTQYADNTVWQMSMHRGIIALEPGYMPHSYRFLPDCIVGIFNWLCGDFAFSRFCYRALFDTLMFAAIYRYARLFLGAIASALTVAAIALVYPISIVAYAGQFVDPASHLSFVACLYFLARGNDAGFGANFFLGIFSKESVIVMAVFRVFHGKRRLRSALIAVAYLAAALAVLVTIRSIVHHGRLGFRSISGVGYGHVLDCLSAWREWGPLYLASLGVLLPGAILGIKLMDRTFQLTCGLLLASLFVSSLLFSWLTEVRNLVPAFVPLAIATMKYLETRFLAGGFAAAEKAGRAHEKPDQTLV